jgi:hypothetical protein
LTVPEIGGLGGSRATSGECRPFQRRSFEIHCATAIHDFASCVKPLKILCSQGHTLELSPEAVEAVGCNNRTPQLLDFQAYFCAEE